MAIIDPFFDILLEIRDRKYFEDDQSFAGGTYW